MIASSPNGEVFGVAADDAGVADGAEMWVAPPVPALWMVPLESFSAPNLPRLALKAMGISAVLEHWVRLKVGEVNSTETAIDGWL